MRKRSDAHRDHVLGNLLATSHAGVVTIGNNIAQPVVNDDLDFDIGILRQKCSEFWQQDRVGSVSVAVIRTVPAGFSRNSRTAETSASISSKRGPMVCSRRSPASVGATLRVVRVSSRTPRRASSSRMVWLREDCDMPSCAAARVKLRACQRLGKPEGHRGCRAAFIALRHKSFRIIAASRKTRTLYIAG